jgi:hypothetical protein
MTATPVSQSRLDIAPAGPQIATALDERRIAGRQCKPGLDDPLRLFIAVACKVRDRQKAIGAEFLG